MSDGFKLKWTKEYIVSDFFGSVTMRMRGLSPSSHLEGTGEQVPTRNIEFNARMLSEREKRSSWT